MTKQIELKDRINLLDKKFKNDKKVQEFEKSLESFKKLVEIGITKERGNNLMSISDRTKFNYFNI